jgi:hypothetical protein
MTFTYQTGEEVKKGDRVLYHGEPAEVEFVADPVLSNPETSWYVKEFGGGVMVVEPKVFGRAFLPRTDEAEDLVFVSRGRLASTPYRKKVVLHTPNGYCAALDALVAEFIKDGVIFVGVVGQDCSKVEDIIDEICVGDGSKPYEMLTSSHPEESLEQAVIFARSLTGDFSGDVEIVELLDSNS